MGSEIALQVSVDLCDAAGKVSTEAGYSEPGGLLLTHYNASGTPKLETYYLDAHGDPHIYTPATGSKFYVYKVTVKAPSTAPTGDDLYALQGVKVNLKADRLNSSAALFHQTFETAFANVNCEVGDDKTSIASATVYTFASDLSSLTANQLLATVYVGVRVDGGSTSTTGQSETSGNALKADFKITALKG